MPASKEAPNACSPCSARKRRCDRVMPACGWCVKRNNPCHYVDHNNKQYLPEFPEKGFQLLFQQGRAAGPDSGCNKDLDYLLTAHLLDTLQQLTLDLGDITECFLLFVQPWMPIIHPATLRQKVLTLRGAPSAELACFLLHILLVNPPTSLPSLRAFLPVLYEDCKSLFYLLQARRRDRLLTIQSGLLLAVYEQGHCSSSDAYISLASCASLAHVMGLGQPFDGTASANDENSEDRRRVWWALYFLDRLNYYSDEKSARIPLLRNAQMGGRLPGSDELWGYRDGWTRSAPSTVPSVPGKELMAISAFGELIQAMHTMQCVLQLTRELSVHPETLVDQESWKLDLLVRQKIHNSLAYSKPLHHQYMVVALHLMALIELHEKGWCVSAAKAILPMSGSLPQPLSKWL
ncbi:hypothetical protein K469DRAFT_710351 [Zopfia rhizophila CBS 207.26]|uniref:Zn(2)-C6 fungal-type domain-containing protein n=1 Tax=Zopfia rhizophila CBS 207.26 TaxID=1314779 RepID=A0A6A6DZY7_9PEZI|nr:hypothetical protein K469DRAFT_710351 [Zopfia rhizophila CBS 207.26]